MVAGLALGSGTVFAAGLLDDVWGLRPWQKIAAQLAAAAIVYSQGVRVSTVANMELDYWLSAPVTLVWLVGCSNAFNLIDGLDGLAAGMGLVATLTILLAGVFSGNEILVLVTAPLAGAIAGFLRYNFNPASIFLGDSGSLLIGFLLGCYGAIWSQKSAALLGLTAPAMVIAIPLLDAGLAIVRRWLAGRPIFAGDRNHIHHKLLEKGLPHRRVVLVLYCAAALCASLSLLHFLAPARFGGLFVTVFVLAAWQGIRRLGYDELVSASRAIQQRTFRQNVRRQLVISGMRKRIIAAGSLDECWEEVAGACRHFGLARIEVWLAGQHYQAQLAAAELDECWDLRAPVSRVGWIRVWHAATPPLMEVGPLVASLAASLSSRMAELSAGNESPAHRVNSSLIRLAESLEERANRPRDPVPQ
jgi:UDP-GlcNAc:undecaprenyl-phosphate GlcNAc-1-phosphate transferase